MEKRKINFLSIFWNRSILTLSVIFSFLTITSNLYSNYYRWDFFEENEISKNISSEKSSVSLSTLRSKDGNQSLLWSFDKNGKLVYEQEIDLSNDDNVLPQTFLLWIYSEKPINDVLKVSFTEQGNVKKYFEVNLNFKGWRGIAVPFRDMSGVQVDKLDKVELTVGTEGQLYLDQLFFNLPVDNRNPIPDYITPFVNPSVNTAVNKNWNALYMYDRMLDRVYPVINMNYNGNINPSTASIIEKFEYHIGENASGTVDAVLATFDNFKITENNGVIDGKILDYPARQAFLRNENVFNEEERKYLLDSIQMRDLGKNLLDMAKLLRYSNITEEDRNKLSDSFILGTKYIFDQGFVRGSSMQVVTHLGYQNREMFDAWFLMRDLLRDRGLLSEAQGSMMWHTGLGRIFEDPNTIVDANVDILNTQLQWMLKSILLIGDEKQQNQLATQFKNWLDTSLLQSKGIAGGFKEDGSIFHHGQHYVAYGRDAFNGLAPTVYAMSGSDYALSNEAQKLLEDVIMKTWIYTKDTEIPVVLSGRHPTGLFKISAEPFKWFALSEVEGSKEKFGGVYAALKDLDSFEGIDKANDPVGAWSMNYASMVIQRRNGLKRGDSWLAIARGFSRYFVGNEAYQANNRYSRYLQYGNLEILPSDISKRGFNHSGWDWNRYPGTTAINLPYPELKSVLHQLPAAGVEEMLLSTESYAGGTALNGNSMYAIKLHGHSKYGQQDFRARKSYFLFDDQIIALGTGIQGDKSGYNVETTLFQHHVPNLESVEVNGEEVNELGVTKVVTGDAEFVDPAGNSYFIKDNGDPIVFTYKVQKSLDDRNDKETEAQFATAVINHGNDVTNGSYEYVILVENEIDLPNYEVLWKDDSLHAVRNVENDVLREGYAFFEPINGLDAGIVTGSNKSVIVMAEQSDENSLSLSVVNPDFAFYRGVEADQVDENGLQKEVSVYSRKWWAADSDTEKSTIVIRGLWKLSNRSNSCATVKRQKGSTYITVETIKARSCLIELEKR